MAFNIPTPQNPVSPAQPNKKINPNPFAGFSGLASKVGGFFSKFGQQQTPIVPPSTQTMAGKAFGDGLQTQQFGGFTIPTGGFTAPQAPAPVAPLATRTGPMTPVPPGTFQPQVAPQIQAPTPQAPTAPPPPTAPQQFTTPSGAVVDMQGNLITPPPGQPAPQAPQAPPQDPQVPPTPPVPPEIPPETTTAVQSAEKAVQEALKISPEALSTQEDLDKLIESTQKAYLNIEDQPIPLEFITGQLQSVEKRALGLAEPLTAKLARLQASRTSSLEASKFALERADKAVEAGKVEAPVAGAGQFTLSKGAVRFDDQGNVVASNIGSEGLSGGFGGVGYVQGENPTVDSWVNLINSGQSTISNVPADLKNAVANALTAGGSSETDSVKAQLLQDKIDNIDSLISHEGMKKSVGPAGLARWTPFKVDTFTGEVQDFVSGVHQLAAKETLDYLINLKAQGGTLGALNQSELDILKESATRINDWEIKDKNGQPTGKWNISESLFKAELNTLRDLTQRALEKAVGGTGAGDTITELEDDITQIGNTLGTREILIEKLLTAYPEFDRDFIASRVYSLIPD